MSPSPPDAGPTPARSPPVLQLITDAGPQIEVEGVGAQNDDFSQTTNKAALAKQLPMYDKINTPLHLHERDPEPAAEVDDEGVSEIVTPPPSISLDDKMTLRRGPNEIHVRTALKLALGGRDFVHSSRGKRHMAFPFVSSSLPFPDDHDVRELNHYAIKHGGKIFVVQITHIEENGKKVKSLNARSRKNSGLVRGLQFEAEKKGYIRSSGMITNWFKSISVLCEVQFEDAASGHLTEDAIALLEDEGFWRKLEEETSSEETEEVPQLEEGYYEVSAILNKRFNSKHQEEFLVAFKGYGADQNQWLTAECLNFPVKLTTVSSTGRTIQHKSKDQGMSAV